MKRNKKTGADPAEATGIFPWFPRINLNTAPAAAAVLTFLLAAVLAAAGALPLEQSVLSLEHSAGNAEPGSGEHTCFEEIWLSGQSAFPRAALTAGAVAKKNTYPPAAMQAGRLHLRRQGKWIAYVPSDLSDGFYLHFSGFDSLRLTSADGAETLTVRSGTWLSAEALCGLQEALSAGAAVDKTVEHPEEEKAQDGQTSRDAKGSEASQDLQDHQDQQDLQAAQDAGPLEKLRLQAAALSRDGEILEETDLVFCFAREIPTLYLETASGSMETVNADKSYTEKGSYLFLGDNGNRDASGTCKLHGRGNSSWKEDKKQYSLNLTDSAEVLGMEASRKFALIANHSDASNLRNKTAFDIARLCSMPASPQSVFVNVYFNGTYNGLYLLAQRPNARGGSVEVADLEAANEKAARQDPGSTVAVPDPEGLEIHAFGRRAVPDNITGGYLLEIDGRYEDEDCWFSTQRHHFVIKYPEDVPLQEAEYIAEYMREAEKAIYAEDGKNPDTGRSWEEYLDPDSWAKMYLVQDFMVQWDVESFSFFVYKDADDPLLYCGPVWDFDLSMGTTGLGRLPNLMQRSMWLEDHRPGWLTQLYTHETFSRAVQTIYQDTFAPALEAYLDSAADSYTSWMDRLRVSAGMDAYRWEEEDSFSESAENLRAWLLGRLDFYTDHEAFPEEYCRVTFRYGFADMNVYVRLEGAASDAAGGGASDAAGSGGGGAVSGYGQDMDGVEAAGGEACHGMSEGASHGRKAVVRAVYKDGGYYDEKGCLLTGVTGWIHRYLNLAATISAPEYSGEDYIPPQDSLR